MTLYRKSLGNTGEQQTVNYLLANGYTILSRQYTDKKLKGEIDIIAQKNNIIAFIEVKTRKNSYNITIKELISQKKQKTIITMALLYCQENNIFLSDYIIRFDLAYVIQAKIEYYENAFTAK